MAVFGRGESLLDGAAVVGAAALGCEGVGWCGGGLVAEGYAGSGLMEEADGGCADASGASCDEGGAACEGEGDAGTRIILHLATLSNRHIFMQVAFGLGGVGAGDPSDLGNLACVPRSSCGQDGNVLKEDFSDRDSLRGLWQRVDAGAPGRADAA